MATDSEPAPASERSSSAPSTRKKKKKKVAKPISRPLTESEINVPDISTIIMLGALGVTSITLWIFAHAGCNYHPPRETRRPRNVTTADLTHEPKDAAIEFQHRLLTGNYKGAVEVSANQALAKAKEGEQACAANPGDCATKRKAAVNAISSAVVLERNALVAKVRVTTSRLPGEQSFLVLVERDIGVWKATAQVPATEGATLPPPSLTTNAPPVRFNVVPTPAPSDSAAPVTLKPIAAPPAAAAPKPAPSAAHP